WRELAAHLLGAASQRSMLFDGGFESGFAKVHLGKRAPNLHLGYVRHVLRDGDGFLHFLIFCHQPVQEISLAVGIDHLPMRVRGLWCDEVVGERKCALTVFRSVLNEPFVCFCALERATLVSILSNAACRSNDQSS